MTVTYTLEPADFVARDKFTVTRGHARRRYAVPFTIFLLMLFGLVVYLFFTGNLNDAVKREIISRGLSIVGCALAAVLFVYLRRNYYYQHVFKQDSAEVYVPTTVTITPEFLTTGDEFGTSSLRWRVFKGVGQDSRCIYLWCVNDSDEMLIIPKRAFPAPTASAEFFRAAQANFDAAQAEE